ncbi:uncharacterized protein LOC130959871 [Arachis stenosperma]|uniref:uncharacterized protein LOC130959871 n=1 Tax=Arachis stenosperma TaxID=217475 RepID=UPI0025ACF908|nr:uncharacterized protein LOC130959871 [Arachis stenosperma]
MKNRGDTIKRLESQVGYLSQQIPKPTDSFPSDSEKNSKGEANKVRWEECKMVTISDEENLEEMNNPSGHLQGGSRAHPDEKDQRSELTQRKQPEEKEVLNPYAPRAPFPQRLKGGGEGKVYSRFLDMFSSLHVNIPFIKALQQIPSYIKCMKELLTKKNSLKGGQTIVMNKECSALIQTELLTKRKDLGSFHIPYAIGETRIDRGLCDLGENINLMPLSLMKKLQINELTPTYVIIQLADKTQRQAMGVIENVLVKVGNYFLPKDFIVLEMEKSHIHPIIMGRPFLATTRALVDVERGELILRIHDEQLTFNVFKPSQVIEQENPKLKDDHNKTPLKETSKETQIGHLKTPRVEKQDSQMLQQPRKTHGELNPQ